MLRYLGAICIFLFAFYSIFTYERYQKQRVLCEEQLLRFLVFLENETAGLGRPMARCVVDFPSRIPLLAPFFSSLESGDLPGNAYRAVREALPLSDEMDACLLSAFDSFGGDRGEVRRGLSDARMRYAQLLDEEKEAHGRRLRLFRTLTTASAMGLVIMLL